MDFENEDRFRDWLVDKPESFAPILASWLCSRSIASFAAAAGAASASNPNFEYWFLRFSRSAIYTMTSASSHGTALSSRTQTIAHSLSKISDIGDRSWRNFSYCASYTALAASTDTQTRSLAASKAARAYSDIFDENWNLSRNLSEAARWVQESPTSEAFFSIPIFSAELTPQILKNNQLYSNPDLLFWSKWLEGLLTGKPLDWELQVQIAKIDDRIWDDGPAAVAREIERIEAEHLRKKLPQAERIEFDFEDGKFHAIPRDVERPNLIGATLTQVRDALEDVLATPANGLHDNSLETRKLSRTLDRYGNDPQQIEMGFASVLKGLTRQFLNDELPASEENLALRDALEEGVRAIHATHPDVAEHRKILNEQTIRELPKGAKETLENALPVLVAISDDHLADGWKHDIPQLINDATLPLPSGAPPLPGVDETTRIFSRAAKISIWLKVSEVVHKIDGSAGYKAARIVTTVSALVSLGLLLIA